MNETVFWALIAMLNWDATGNDEAVVAPVVDELSRKCRFTRSIASCQSISGGD